MKRAVTLRCSRVRSRTVFGKQGHRFRILSGPSRRFKRGFSSAIHLSRIGTRIGSGMITDGFPLKAISGYREVFPLSSIA